MYLRGSLCAAASLLLAFSYMARANAPVLVSDINTQPIGVSSNPVFLGTLGSTTFFSATDGVHGVELWKTDGTTAGTVMVLDIEPGSGSSNPTNFAVMGSVAYFAATTQASGTKLWVTDGTAAGTHKVTDLAVGDEYAIPTAVGMLGTTVLIAGNDPNGSHLWATDGTASGTVLLANIGFLPRVHPDGLAVAANGKAYFDGNDTVNGGQPWVTDGTPAGTHVLSTQGNFDPSSFIQVGGSVYYVQGINQFQSLFRINLADDSIAQVTTGIGVEDYSSGTQPPGNLPLVALGNLVLFIGINAGVEQVWRSDGTSAGTYALINYSSAAGNSYVAPRFNVVGTHAFFLDEITLADLYSTDGTVAGTTNLGFAATDLLGTAGNYLYFIAQGSLDRSDGTIAGTQPINIPGLSLYYVSWSEFAGNSTSVYFDFEVFDANSDAGDYQTLRYDPVANATTVLYHDPLQPGPLFALSAGRLYFGINQASLGFEPGVSDGTVAGTHLLADIASEPTDGSSNPNGFVNFNGELYFSANDGISGNELWRSDGTAAGTELASDIVPGASSSNPVNLFVAGNSVMFFARGGPPQYTYLWRYDVGGASASYLPAVGSPYSCSTLSTPSVQGVTFFSAYDFDVDVWRTDGTVAGTVDVPITKGILYDPCSVVAYAGKAYVIAWQTAANAGYSLWSTDGTAAGAKLVASLGSQPPATPFFVTPYAGSLYFVGLNSSAVPTLWRSDGTAAGTHSVAPLPAALGSFVGVVNDKLLFTGAQTGTTFALWTFDSKTDAFASIPGVFYDAAGPLAENGGAAYFTGIDTTHTLGPWVTDGTVAGTKPLVDAQGNYPNNVQWVGDFHSVAIYTGVNSANVSQYWRSDGTLTGTHSIASLGAGQSVSITSPSGLAIGNRFYFAVSDPVIGTELYSLQSDVPVVTSTSLTGAPVSAVVGSPVVLTATVTPAAGGIVPTGNVTFSDGANLLGTVALNSAGVAEFNTTTLAVGTHTITAAYVGSATDALSASTSVTVTITAPAPSVTLTSAPTSITLGGSATLTWSSTNATGCTASGAWSGTEGDSGSQTVTPTATGSLTYTLACTGGGGKTQASATLTVNPAPKSGGGGGSLNLGGLAGLALLVGFNHRRRRARARRSPVIPM